MEAPGKAVFNMKKLIYLTGLILAFACSKEDDRETFTGKLVLKGICMNYVIQVNDDNFPRNMLEENWSTNRINNDRSDKFSEIEYQNVFALKSICDFPESIDEGDYFNFVIDNDKDNFCAVCEAYSPVPRKSVSITVTEINN